MGACVIAACTLLNRASDDRHRVVLAADDAMDHHIVRGDEVRIHRHHPVQASEFGAVCEAVTAKSAAAARRSGGVGQPRPLRWRPWRQPAAISREAAASQHVARGAAGRCISWVAARCSSWVVGSRAAGSRAAAGSKAAAGRMAAAGRAAAGRAAAAARGSERWTDALSALSHCSPRRL